MYYPSVRSGKRILVVGSGGREHALVWALAQSPRVGQVIAAPGNGGTALESKAGNAPIAATDTKALMALARKERIDLIVVGPEAPLVGGIADAARAAGLRLFGPSGQAAKITEGSKCDAKDFMSRHGIPTAPYRNFSDGELAKVYLSEHPLPVVIKGDGLAGGKGVVIAEIHQKACEAADKLLWQHRRIVVEECLDGEELSFTCIVAGREVLPLATARDHKRLQDDDRGPMTGGMGAYSPVPFVDAALYRRIMDAVVLPTVQGLAAEGIPYTGFLYFGLMAVGSVPYVLEFNCRLGDPEAQVVLPRLRNDLFEVIEATLEDRLWNVQLDWDRRAALSVVLVAPGYPHEVQLGDRIDGLTDAEQQPGVKVFHSGTAIKDRQFVTAGGRVLAVTALGGTLREARKRAYAAVDKIAWPGMQYRRDIGYRAIIAEGV